MMKIPAAAVCVLSFFLCFSQQTDPALLFEAGFDRFTANADRAAGASAAGGIDPDLSLRMFPGAAGKGNAVNLRGEECISWSAFKNFDPRQGTVSFWIAPGSWDRDKKGLTSFFRTRFGEYTFAVYEENKYNTFSFVIAVHKPKYREIGKVRLDMPRGVWVPGRWHKIDAVWNDRMMALYLDGALAKPRKFNKNPWLFDTPVTFPGMAPKARMQLGWGKPGVQDTNSFDDLKIYDRCLSASEIKLKYEERVPRRTAERTPRVPVPGGRSITPDGRLDGPEWADASRIVVRNPCSGLKVTDLYAKVFLKKNDRELMIGAEIAGGGKADITGNDIVDIWRDDAFEFHVMTADKKRLQFIVNPAGALFDAIVARNDGVYDQRKLDPKWQSGAKVAVSRGDGKWFLEMTVPRKSIGADSKILAVNFCATRWREKAEHVNWGVGCDKFYDEKHFGTLLFKSSAPAVRMDECTFREGEFRLDMTPGVAARLVSADGKVMPRPAGKSWRLALAEGIYEFSAQAKDFFYAASIEASKPFEMDYICRPSKERLDVLIDLSGAGGSVRKKIASGKVACAVSLFDGGKKARISRTFAVGGLKSVFSVPLPGGMEQGVWQVKAAVVEDGRETLSAWKRMRVPDMTPFLAKVADDHSVPPPWTPVEQAGKYDFKVWNRLYRFGNGPFPVRVVSGKNDMLVSPPEFRLDGRPVRWSAGKVVEKFDDGIGLEGTGEAPGLKFTWRTVISFDGLVSVTVRMRPAGKSADISKLELDWAVPAEFARAMLDPQLSAWGNKEGEVLSFPYAHGEDFLIWTMGVRHGFVWHPVSSANWRHPMGHKPFTMKRVKDRVEIGAEFISVKSRLEKEAVYDMVFMATPTRPEPERWRDTNMGHIWGSVKHESWRVQYYLPSAKPRDQSTEPWTGLVALDPVKYQKHIDELEKQGTKYMPYCQPMMLESIDDYYDMFFREWKQIPGYSCGSGVSFRTGEHYIPESCCGRTGAEDLGVWRADRHFADFPKIPGIYYDCAQARTCNNVFHGCGGVDAFGREYASSGATRHRNFYIRLKRVMAKHGRDKVLFIHAHERFVPFMHGLGDYFATGEQYFNTMNINPRYFYAENIPLKSYQSLYCTATRGTGMLFSTAYAYNVAHKHTKEDCNRPEYTLAFMTVCLLHDLSFGSQWLNNACVEPWWVIKHDIDLAAADFHGYWFSDAVKTGREKVFASWYSWKKQSPYRCLIIVGNLNRKNLRVDVTCDWRKLGIDPAKAVFTDLWTGKPLASLDGLEVKNNDFRLIGIKVLPQAHR